MEGYGATNSGGKKTEELSSSYSNYQTEETDYFNNYVANSNGNAGANNNSILNNNVPGKLLGKGKVINREEVEDEVEEGNVQ